MIRIMFVCLGNICRSPMAQFVMQDMVNKAGLGDEFFITSSGTSNEEEGNPVHYGTKQKLARMNIPCGEKYACKLHKSDYERYDYIIAMEQRNLNAIMRFIGSDSEKKVHRLCDFTTKPRDIADPWYTGNFDLTYDDIVDGCTAFLKKIKP